MARKAAVRDVCAALNGATVPAVFLKGVALAEQVYPRPATRPSSDVDVWIRSDDLSTAVAALSRSGFVRSRRFDDPSDPRGPVPMIYLEKSVAGAPILVDLHVRPMSLRDLSDVEVQAIWASRVTAGPSALPVLRLDVQLLHVCLHIARSHGFVSGLKVLVDIAMIVGRWPDERLWDEFSSRVVEIRAAHPVFVCLELARELLAVPIPRAVLDELGAGTEAGVIDLARPLLWSRDPALPLGTTMILGGGIPEPDWFRNRLRLRRHISTDERRRMTRADRAPLRVMARFLWRRLWSVSRLILCGEAFTPRFWKRVAIERRRNRVMRALYRAQPRRSRAVIA
jgi:hypothetical protein